MDVFIVVDSCKHPAFRRPYSVAQAITFGGPDEVNWNLGAVRSVTVLDSSTGLTANSRNDDAAWGEG